MEISKTEIKDRVDHYILENSLRPYVRTKSGELFYAENIHEAFMNFISEDGFRITYVVDNKQYTIWKKVDTYSQPLFPHEIERKNATLPKS